MSVPVAIVQLTPEGGELMALRSSWLGILEVMQRQEAYKNLVTMIWSNLPPRDNENSQVVTMRLERYIADVVLAVAGRYETIPRELKAHSQNTP